MSAPEQLDAIRREVVSLLSSANHCFRRRCFRRWKRTESTCFSMRNLPAAAGESEPLFRRKRFPVLTPLAFDPGRPFPHISNLSLNWQCSSATPKARSTLPVLRFQTFSSARTIRRSRRSTDSKAMLDQSFIWLEDLIAANLNQLFPRMKILESHSVSRFARRRSCDPGVGSRRSSGEYRRRTSATSVGDVVHLKVNTNMHSACRNSGHELGDRSKVHL